MKTHDIIIVLSKEIDRDLLVENNYLCPVSICKTNKNFVTIILNMSQNIKNRFSYYVSLKEGKNV